MIRTELLILLNSQTCLSIRHEHASLGSRDSAIAFAGDPTEIYQQNPLVEKAFMPEDPSIALAAPLAESMQRDREGWYCRTAHTPVLSSQESASHK